MKRDLGKKQEREPKDPFASPPEIIVNAGLAGGGFDDGGVPDNTGGDDGRDPCPNGWGETPIAAKRLAVWILVGSLSMMFIALSVIYLVRFPTRAGFAYPIPALVWINTLVLMLSSVTLSKGYKAILKDDLKTLEKMLSISLALGVAFVGGQLWSWHLLEASGILPSHYLGGFFYIFTGFHGGHLLTGIAVLGWLLFNAKKRRYHAGNALSVELGALYWHFLDALWVALFALILMMKL